MTQSDMSPRDFAWSIYQHADNLQHQRFYNFATTQAFVFVGAGIGASGNAPDLLLPMIAMFGVLLAVAWWAATIRLERPQVAVRRHFEHDSVYKDYHVALWQNSASLLVNHIPPVMAFAAWFVIFVESIRESIHTWGILSFCIGLLVFVVVVSVRLDKWESNKRSQFLKRQGLDKPPARSEHLNTSPPSEGVTH